jgi:hypothetical protein
MPGDQSPMAKMLAAYRPIMARFLSGESTAEDFEREYLAVFENDANQALGDEFDVMDGLSPTSTRTPLIRSCVPRSVVVTRAV